MKQLPREMTNYEKIKYLLEMWVYKGVEVIYQWAKIIFYWYREWDINWHYLYWESWTLSESRVNSNETTSITPIPNPPKLLPVGTKVRVFEEYRDKKVNKAYKWAFASKDTDFYVYRANNLCYTLNCSFWQPVVPARSVYPVWED